MGDGGYEDNQNPAFSIRPKDAGAPAHLDPTSPTAKSLWRRHSQASLGSFRRYELT